MGGSEPTVTDGNLVLGWLKPQGTGRRRGPARRRRPRAWRWGRVSRNRSGCAPEAAAFGAVEIATASMIRAIRAVSSERGARSTRLRAVAFGGNGGIFGPLVARSLGMKRVVIPPSPGLFSAAGLL